MSKKKKNKKVSSKFFIWFDRIQIILFSIVIFGGIFCISYVFRSQPIEGIVTREEYFGEHVLGFKGKNYHCICYNETEKIYGVVASDVLWVQGLYIDVRWSQGHVRSFIDKYKVECFEEYNGTHFKFEEGDLVGWEKEAK